MSSLAALPAPSSVVSSSSGLGVFRRAFGTDAAPVRAVDATTPATRRSPDTVDDADSRRSSAVTTTTERGGSGNLASSSSGDSSSTSTTAVALSVSAVSSAAFTTQSLSQEVVGAGLHIEPWSTAIDAYSRADAGNSPRSNAASIVV